MSQYGIIYRMEFKNVEGFTIRVNISPTDVLIGDLDTPVIYTLTGSANPVTISTMNNDEDKFQPIRSKSARIQFVTDTPSGLNSATFSQGGDNLWVCDIILQDTPEYIFRGFLIMADNQQPFQPDPQYVTLTATDHLGTLKELPWVDYNGDNPAGPYKVGVCIAFALLRTGLALNIKVVNNLRAGGAEFTMSTTFNSGNSTLTVPDTKMFYAGQHILTAGTVSNNGSLYVESVDSPTQITVVNTITSEGPVNTTITDYDSQYHWYDRVYLEATTFESEIGRSENCYTVLEKILGEDCFLTQWKGEWWIFRVDEIEDNPLYVAEFDSNGIYVSTATEAQYDKTIGRNEDCKFANADTLLRFIRPHGYIRETMRFVSPLEVPCNKDYTRGAFITDIDATTKKYDIECWTLYENRPPVVSTHSTAFIIRKFVNDYENERYIVIDSASSAIEQILISGFIRVGAKDKFDLSVDVRHDGQIDTGSGLTRVEYMQVQLHADDGTYYTLYGGRNAYGGNPDAVPVWVACTSSFDTNQQYFGATYDKADDDTQWRQVTFEYGDCPEIPKSGKIRILFTTTYKVDQFQYHYANLVFEYLPYIDGSYKKFTGYCNQIDRTETGYFANREKDVFIGDLPRPILKGAMYLKVDNGSGDAYWLFPNWFASAPFGGTYTNLPSMDYLHNYGWIQAYSVWNQYKGYKNALDRGIGINVFSGSVLGLTDTWPDLLHRYELTDTDLQTINRYFMLISLEQNWKTCIWTGTFVEVYQRVIMKTYDDALTFKYLEQ